ncbi:hypothetical protein [Pseudonocardia alni]|uniref:hypothetical protein n=1 Tax=Pseudonocardia alni TaxID=33907 RepID=UPI0033225DE2
MTPTPRHLDPSSDEAVPAVLWTSAAFGFDITEVLSPTTWGVVAVGPEIDVWLDANALRAVALLSEDPRKTYLAERIIRAAGR